MTKKNEKVNLIPEPRQDKNELTYFWDKLDEHNGLCPKGGKHEWGTDGVHYNEFCKKCFIDKP